MGTTVALFNKGVGQDDCPVFLPQVVGRAPSCLLQVVGRAPSCLPQVVGMVVTVVANGGGQGSLCIVLPQVAGRAGACLPPMVDRVAPCLFTTGGEQDGRPTFLPQVVGKVAALFAIGGGKGCCPIFLPLVTLSFYHMWWIGRLTVYHSWQAETSPCLPQVVGRGVPCLFTAGGGQGDHRVFLPQVMDRAVGFLPELVGRAATLSCYHS